MGEWHFSESKVSNRSLPFVEALEPFNFELRKEKDRWLFDKASQRFRVRFLRVLGRFVNLAYLDATRFVSIWKVLSSPSHASHPAM